MIPNEDSQAMRGCNHAPCPSPQRTGQTSLLCNLPERRKCWPGRPLPRQRPALRGSHQSHSSTKTLTLELLTYNAVGQLRERHEGTKEDSKERARIKKRGKAHSRLLPRGPDSDLPNLVVPTRHFEHPWSYVSCCQTTSYHGVYIFE